MLRDLDGAPRSYWGAAAVRLLIIMHSFRRFGFGGLYFGFVALSFALACADAEPDGGNATSVSQETSSSAPEGTEPGSVTGTPLGSDGPATTSTIDGAPSEGVNSSASTDATTPPGMGSSSAGGTSTEPGSGGTGPSAGGASNPSGAGGNDTGTGGNPSQGGRSNPGAGGTEPGAAGSAMGGSSGVSGATSGGSGGAAPTTGLGSGVMTGSGSSDERYETALVSRNDVPYVLITNGWGPGFGDHTVSWEGTSFIVESMTGNAGPSGQPASYPTVFCGRYSVMQVPDCGLPAALDSITRLRTGWRWAANGNAGEYNAAYDIWLGNGTQLQGYLMVWLRDPPSFQPAGMPNMAHQGVVVSNVPGTWNIWDGSVNGLPIINWVRAEGDDSTEIEFDVLDFLRDAEMRGLSFPGTHINAVAVGFEIWEGPIANLESVDFYVEVE